MLKFLPSSLAAASLSAIASLTIVSSMIVGMTPADAQRTRSFSHGAHGPNGRGYTHSGSSSRGGGTGFATQSFQTDRGYGITANRSHSFSNGSFNGSNSRTLNNGTSWGRTTTGVANGNGGADYSSTYTGPNGGTATRSGTIGYH